MKLMYFSIKYHYSDILLKKENSFIYNYSFHHNHTCYCVDMVSVTSASRYVTSASRYQSRSSMYIRGLIPRIWPRLFRSEKTCLWGLHIRLDNTGISRFSEGDHQLVHEYNNRVCSS